MLSNIIGLLLLASVPTTPAMALSVPRNEPPAPITQTILPKDFSSTTTIRQYVIERAIIKGVDVETAVRIANCEGGLRQFNPDGTVLKGFVNPKDIGIFQINETYHLKNAINLGFDIYTPQGNIDYAIDLMSKEGFTPWKWSESCWKYIGSSN